MGSEPNNGVDNPVISTLQVKANGLQLTVLIPVFNEKENLMSLISRVQAVPLCKEILIMDDASTDGTRELLQQMVEGKSPEIRVYYSDHNEGKGASLRKLIPHILSPYAIVQDGDMEYDPMDYLPILDKLKKSGADAVYGSRFMHGWPKMNPANKLINILLAGMVRIFFGVHITDEATCYKAFKTEKLQSLRLTCRRFEFCPEVTAKLLRQGGHILEVPIHYEARSILQGKKIRWTDGVVAIWTLIKYRLIK